ncbi:interleukin-15 receptor subunit alpha [Pteropus medius]|uniref:interleukin-15 receptor subunit alpha n=1 Tax=Pteropus vampyrus TaxID=132908 RepID=UPI00196B5A18|nr:interleukin-15 receptor subunit alpha [Pteropus giganteus]
MARPVPVRGDTRRVARGADGEGSGGRGPGGGAGVAPAAGAFCAGGDGRAESRVCRGSSPLPGPPGAKAKAKANATGGTGGPGSGARRLQPERPARARAGGEAMARARLRGCGARALAALLPPPLLLLLLLRLPATAGTTCSTPTSIEHANIRVKSYNENSRERYICNSGFKRKAGTSSLTKCLRNEDTNVTEWTIPSLKCVRDRSLTPQRPPSTVAPARVTPEPDSPSPSGKEPAFTSKSDVAVATKQAVVPGVGPMPSEPPSAGSPGTVKREPSQAPPQTTAEVVGHTPTSSLDKPGARSYSFTDVTVAVPILVVVLFGATIVVIRVVRCRQSRQTSWTPGVEMENIEDMPMTGGTDGRDDTENRHAV